MFNSFLKWVRSIFSSKPVEPKPNSTNNESEIVVGNSIKRKKRALLVGIDKYQTPGSDLNGCVNDVTDMYDLLTKQYGFMPDDVRVITNERASMDEIIHRLEWLIENTAAGDEAFFYQSSHGSQVRDRDGDELSDNLDECVSANTLISTDVGLVRADRLHEYLSLGGKCKAKLGKNFYSITNSKKVRKQGLVRVATDTGMVSEFSKNHKVTTFSNGLMIEKYANDLTDEDVLLNSSKIWEGNTKIDSLWYLIGLFIGDGHFQSGRSIRFGVRKDIDDWKNVANIARNDLNIHDITESFNCRNDYVLRIGDDHLCSILKGLGFKAGKKKTGCMNDIPLPLNESCWKGLLRGLFDSEGCSTDKSISFSSTDYLLIKLVLIGLNWFGIKSSVYARPQKDKANKSWVVSIGGKNVLEFDRCIGFGFKSKQKKRSQSLGNGFQHGKIKLPEIIDFLEKYNLKFFDFYAAMGLFNQSSRENKKFHKEHIEKVVDYLIGISALAKSITENETLEKRERLSIGASINQIEKSCGLDKFAVNYQLKNNNNSSVVEYSHKLEKDVNCLIDRDWSILKSYDLMQIDKVLKEDVECDFYDFTVAEVERFEADGILVHNCLITYDHDWNDPLVDDIIGRIFKGLNKEAYLTVMIDACHSGTITKSFNNPTLSGETYCKEKFVAPPFDIMARSLGRELPLQNFGVKSGDEEDQRHILLSGCREDQTSKELAFGNQIRGALTFNFSKFLRANPNLSWREIHSAVHSVVRNMQDPELRGMSLLKNRKVFGGKE